MSRDVGVNMASAEKPKTENGGRTKLTPECQRILVESIQLGCTDKAACQRAGIDQNTLIRWHNLGAEGKQPFADFVNVYTRAKGERTARLAGNILKAAPEDWRAAAWYLEHAESNEFGVKTKTEVTGPEGKPLDIQVLFGVNGHDVKTATDMD